MLLAFMALLETSDTLIKYEGSRAWMVAQDQSHERLVFPEETKAFTVIKNQIKYDVAA